MYVPKRTSVDASRIAELRDDAEHFQGMDMGMSAEDEGVTSFLTSKSSMAAIDEASDDFSKRAKKLVRDLLIAQSPKIISRDHLKEVARVQRSRFYGCLSLPFSFCFFLFFAASVVLHEDITNVYFIESGLRVNIGTGIESVVDIEGCWKWINTTLIPNIFDQKNLFGEPEKDKRYWNRVLMYNQLTGPLVMEQVRSKQELCFDGDGIYGDMVCYPKDTSESLPMTPRKLPAVPPPKAADYSGGNVTVAERRDFWLSAFSSKKQRRRRLGQSRLFVDKQGRRIPWSRRLRLMRTEYKSRLPGGSFYSTKKHKYRAFFYPNTPYDVTTQHVKFLEEAGWIDEQTKEIRIKFMLLNAEVGRPRLEQSQIVFRFSRGGGVFARQTLETIFLKTWDGKMSYGSDVCFTVSLLLVTIFEIGEAVRASKKRTLKQHMKQAWTILELLIVVFGWLVLMGYAMQYSYLQKVKDDLQQVTEYTNKDLPGEKSSLGEELLVSSDDMVYYSSYFRILQAEYHLILMFRFFTAFYAQPRLGVVTATLAASVIDIIHFLIVLMPTFMAYSISGVFLFGRRMEEFSTFEAAMGNCFKMAMEGEYDWDELSREHYYTAFAWVGTFMLLIVQLMMNMVLAIVMDIYTIKRQAAGNSETVDQTLFNMYTRFKHYQVWVSNKELYDTADKMEPFLTREDMLYFYPGMGDEQLDPFMFAVKYQQELDTMQGIDISDSMRMTMAVKLAIDKVHLDMQELTHGDQTTLAENAALVNREWFTGLADQMASHSHWMLGIQWQLQQLQWQWSAIESVHAKGQPFPSGGASTTTSTDIVL